MNYYYDWRRSSSDDPRFPNGPPYNCVERLTIDGCDVTKLLFFRVETGPNGTVSARVTGKDGALVEFPRGEACSVVLKGSVEIQFKEQP